MKKTLKLATSILLLFVSLVVAACGNDDDEDMTMHIYGTYDGKVTASTNTIPAETHDAELQIIKAEDNTMKFRIESKDGKFNMSMSQLPVLDVSGNKDYSYEWKSEEKKIKVNITSPDFQNVQLKYVDDEENKNFVCIFEGIRN